MAEAVIAGSWLAGLLLVSVLARRAGGDGLLRIVAAGYVIRAAFAVGLYVTSLWHLPWLAGVQLGGGFWRFAPDASYFHAHAVETIALVRAGQEPPYVFGSPEYPLIVTTMYRLLGQHPLAPIALNLVAAGATAVLAHAIAVRGWGERAGLAAAALVTFWPSAMLWSTQMLKDTLQGSLTLAFVWFVITLVRDHGSRVRALVLAAGAALAIAASMRLRYYVAVSLLGASGLALLTHVAVAVRRGRYARAAACAALAVTVTVAGVAATWLTDDVFGKRSQAQVAIADAPAIDIAGEHGPGSLRGRLSGSELEAIKAGMAAGDGIETSVPTPGDLRSLLTAVPAAFVAGLLTPHPFMPVHVDGATGVLPRVAMIEVALLVPLLGFALAGLWHGREGSWDVRLLLGAFALVTTIALGIAVPNVGTLFRLRLAAILPLCILAGGSGVAQRTVSRLVAS